MNKPDYKSKENIIATITAAFDGKQCERRVTPEDDWRTLTVTGIFYSLSLGCEVRIKPEAERVPLEPCDVPPGSIFMHPKWQPGTWESVIQVKDYFIMMASGNECTFRRLYSQGWLIKRPGEAEFSPCSKEAK